VQLGMIGLGRMGGNMVKRLEERGHDLKTYDPKVESTASTLEQLRDELDAPRSFWMMVPAGKITEDTFQALLGLAEHGDVIVDGGNSNFRDSQRRYAAAKEKGIGFVDAGVSGGIWGLEVGYCLMVGGDREAVAQVEPVLHDLAPEDGYAHVGAAGAGHFVKMVHNGIEYGLMQAYAEGLNVLKHANIGKHAQETDAETTPLRDPDLYKYDLDVAAITEVWRRGSVISSWLLDLTAEALHETPELNEYAGRVSDSGEGRWTVQAAIEEGVPTPVLAASLFDRFASRGEADWGNRVLSAMRKGFGGHLEKSPEQ
jgi:6-phosphogluconate dehydrogenase